MKNTNKTLLVAAFALSGVGTVGALNLAATAGHAQERMTRVVTQVKGPSSQMVRLGKPMPDFVLTDVAKGKNTAFTTFSAGKKATVVVFMSTHCPVSNAYEGRLEALATKYGAQGVQFAGIFPDVGEEAPQVAEHAKEKGLTFLCLRDDTAKEARQFKASVTPEVYVSNEKGVLVYHGPVDDSQNQANVTHTYLADALDATLAGKPVTVKSERAFGCQIHLPNAQ